MSGTWQEPFYKKVSDTNGTVAIAKAMRCIELSPKQSGFEYGSWFLHEIVLVLTPFDHSWLDPAGTICDSTGRDVLQHLLRLKFEAA